MNPIEKIKKKVVKEYFVRADNIKEHSIWVMNMGEFIDLIIKKTAKEILDEVENVKHFCRTLRKEEWISVGVFESHLKEVKKSFGVEK